MIRLLLFLIFITAFNSLSAELVFDSLLINENIVYGSKDSFEFKFKFKNTSQSEVKIEKIESICDCTKVASDKFIYMPNEFGVISGMLDIKNKYGEFERRIILHTNDIKSKRVTLSIKLFITEPITLSPQLLFWEKNSKPTTKKTIINFISSECTIAKIPDRFIGGELVTTLEKNGAKIAVTPFKTTHTKKYVIPIKFQTSNGLITRSLYIIIK